MVLRTAFDADIVILAEKVCVRFCLPSDPIRSFKEFVIRRLWGHIGYREVWALRDVNMTVRRGETVGVVGRNGSGKSTLLKTLARVFRPTSGRVYVRGSVAPLLELGSGFHPELTGRENVYLYGALLGHSRREVRTALDKIVEFAELHEFIDAPLRTYSSGMILRLGFAVATAWEPDVLLVDEVLSVGDEAFARRCMERMRRFRENGVTVVVVSHNLSLIREFCSKAMWLDRGVVRATGPSADVVDLYYRSVCEPVLSHS